MRPVSADFNNRLIKKVQTKATNADPHLDLWISRPTTQLIYDELLEKQDVTSSVTDCDVTVQHTKFGRKADSIAIAYVSGGVAKVVTSPYYEAMSRHTWTDSGFSETASKVAIAYDGTMPRDTKGRYEFITSGQPWIFWINSGSVYAKQLGGYTVTLAGSNATAISAVRAMWSDVPGFDFGLCVFFIMSGALYVRQLIDGVWYDAEQVTVLPTLDSGETWVQVDASRTWDYRIALQLVDSAGNICEVFSQYGGIGSKGAEHIEVTNVDADGALTEISYASAQAAEHIEIAGVDVDARLRDNVAMNAVSVANVQDVNGDWNTTLEITLDHPADTGTVAGNESAFSLSSGGNTYACTAISVSEDGYVITLTVEYMHELNNILSYTPGTIDSVSALNLAAFDFEFTPTNLEPDGHDDEHIEITDISATGTLTQVYYTNAQNGGEHIEITSITAIGTLTHVDDI